ncbi:MAG TPA: mannose-1-phosphate guanylyltransferase, partial [Planctomycetes bacterium]|nr:mannose-1-phosphate guanylyltransferase [Planctomycetota bacterium]
MVVTSEDLAPGVREQLPEVELLLEPERRDTAAAIGLAAGVLSARDPEAVLVATPADHVV